MKRIMSLILTFTLLLPLFGCSEKTPEGTTYPYTEYPEPVFTPGKLESDLLTVENGNYDRANRTGLASFLETGTGYYYLKDGLLYYAERDNMNQWVPVCSNPDCGHTSKTCSASIEIGVYLAKDRICFLASAENYPQLYSVDSGVIGYMQCSMELDGTDIQLEHIWENALVGAGGLTACVFPDGYAVTVEHPNLDGSYGAELYWYDTNGECKLLEKTQDSFKGHITFSAAQMFALYGDNALATSMMDSGTFTDSFAWLSNQEPKAENVSDLSARGGYLCGNILRCYRPNDGYYDVDLLTGEETKLADVQLNNSQGLVLQPNCILESDLFLAGIYFGSREPREPLETHMMCFFDGQKWHDVALPEDLLDIPDNRYLAVTALTSDCVVFSTNIDGNIHFYRMALDAEEYKLERCGTFSVS